MSHYNFLYHHFKRIRIKILHWEYWPMWLVYFPVSFYYLYLSFKSKSLFFFSGSNPGIETGGMFFESKWKIFELIPKEYYPPTLIIYPLDNVSHVLTMMESASIEFPIIVKPNRGERGWLVNKIHSESELASYKNSMRVEFLIQSYIDKPLELSVFYFRHPSKENGIITSVTLKKLLSVKGNGKSTIGDLILSNQRSFLQYERLKSQDSIDFNKVLNNGEEFVLVPYGNHALGAMFLDYRHIVDQTLTDTFDEISKRIKGFYYGRFDLRCTRIDDLKKGNNISILELNGAGAEPAHIYDPSYSYFRAQFDLAKHYKMMYQAATENKKRGVTFMTYPLFRATKKSEKSYKLNAFKR